MKDLFLSNYSPTTFISKLKENLSNCSQFCFSVSFVKKAGLILLEKYIEEALLRGAYGRIITSTYQNFTDIEALNTFLRWSKNYPNFKCHLDYNSFGDNGFHSKGYLFKFQNLTSFLIGSTNITRFALLKNVEWNLELSDSNQTASMIEAYKEFDYLWEQTIELSADVIKNYQLQLDYAIEKWDMDYITSYTGVKPNIMQKKALKELRKYRDMGVKKALIVCATGSGKTYLSAFDARNFDAKRVLFVVHRENILRDARDTYKKVFLDKYSYGLYTGTTTEIDCDFVFTTNIMLSNNLSLFLENEFDYIVLDECHHATQSSYKKIINYFKPEFLLGLTATPDRMDNQDVYSLFDKNVPFELRLREALLNDLVVPFHYYGIRDELVNYSDENMSKVASEIANNIHCDFIKQEIEKHKPNGKLKAVAFCKSIEHAKIMAINMQNLDYSTIALTGTNNVGERVKAFNDLQDENHPLEIIFTVDILNEGVDIPGINMVIFLRPTESQTIFIQQLGRGLRKYPGKPYLTVLDFIGNNYARSTQIALALGTLSQNNIIEKKYLMDMIRTNFVSLDLPIQIHIDELSKREILNQIQSTNFNSVVYLKQDYLNFKKYLSLDRPPSHMDYLNSDCSPDLLRLIKSTIKGTKNISYYHFLEKIGEGNIPIFNESQVMVIDAVSDLLPIVREDEYLIINELINGNHYIDDLMKLTNHSNKLTNSTIISAIGLLLSKNIIVGKDKYYLNCGYSDPTFAEYLKDILSYGLTRYSQEFGEFEGKFKLYSNYYKDQIMLLSTGKLFRYMTGTKFEDNNETYIFVGLKKDAGKEELHNYKDKFLSSTVFQWESVNNTTFEDSEGRKLLATKKVHLFIRKMDLEDGITLPFTYFGTGVFKNGRESYNAVIKDGIKKNLPTLMFDIHLDNEVPSQFHLDFNIPEKHE